MSESQKGLEEIWDIDELYNWSFAPGDLLYQSHKLKKYFTLNKVGDPLNFELIDKLKSKGIKELTVIRSVNQNLIRVFNTSLLALKSAPEGQGSEASEHKIKRLVNESFLTKNSKGTVMDAFLITREVLYELPKEYEELYKKKSIALYNRCQVLSSVLIMLSIKFGYRNFDFLKELYQVPFFLDLSLLTLDEFSYKHLRLIELGCGHNISDEKLKIKFRMHPHEGRDIGAKFLRPALASIIEKHHEYNTLVGFPRGLESTWFNVYEGTLLALDKLLPYEQVELNQNFFHFVTELFDKVGEKDSYPLTSTSLLVKKETA